MPVALTPGEPRIDSLGATCLDNGRSLTYEFQMSTPNGYQNFSAKDFEQFEKKAEELNPDKDKPLGEDYLKQQWDERPSPPNRMLDGRYQCKPPALTS